MTTASARRQRENRVGDARTVRDDAATGAADIGARQQATIQAVAAIQRRSDLPVGAGIAVPETIVLRLMVIGCQRLADVYQVGGAAEALRKTPRHSRTG